MTVQTAGKSAWRAMYVHGPMRSPNAYRGRRDMIDTLRFSIGIDPWIGAGSDTGARVFGSFGRWRFRFTLPSISWRMAYRHQWLMPLYKLERTIRCGIDGRYGWGTK
jgi:hypothetical protein